MQRTRSAVMLHSAFIDKHALQDEIYHAFEDFQSGRLQNPYDNVWFQD